MQRDSAVLNTVLRIFLRVVKIHLRGHCPSAWQIDAADIRIGASQTRQPHLKASKYTQTRLDNCNECKSISLIISNPYRTLPTRTVHASLGNMWLVIRMGVAWWKGGLGRSKVHTFRSQTLVTLHFEVVSWGLVRKLPP